MLALAKEEVQKLPRGDVQLAGLSWLPNMSLAFTLLLPDGRQSRLLCTLTHHVRIGLQFEERAGGYALSWDIVYSELPDGGWHVLMGFAHTGAVEFDCAELHFEYVTNTAYPCAARRIQGFSAAELLGLRTNNGRWQWLGEERRRGEQTCSAGKRRGRFGRA